MPLSWNEIRHRAIAFSKDWKGETREAAECQIFRNDCCNVFGVHRRTTKDRACSYRPSLAYCTHHNRLSSLDTVTNEAKSNRETEYVLRLQE